jgi:hypothetical protein
VKVKKTITKDGRQISRDEYELREPDAICTALRAPGTTSVLLTKDDGTCVLYERAPQEVVMRVAVVMDVTCLDDGTVEKVSLHAAASDAGYQGPNGVIIEGDPNVDANTLFARCFARWSEWGLEEQFLKAHDSANTTWEWEG